MPAKTPSNSGENPVLTPRQSRDRRPRPFWPVSGSIKNDGSDDNVVQLNSVAIMS